MPCPVLSPLFPQGLHGHCAGQVRRHPASTSPKMHGGTFGKADSWLSCSPEPGQSPCNTLLLEGAGRGGRFLPMELWPLKPVGQRKIKTLQIPGYLDFLVPRERNIHSCRACRREGSSWTQGAIKPEPPNTPDTRSASGKGHPCPARGPGLPDLLGCPQGSDRRHQAPERPAMLAKVESGSDP